MIRLFSAAAVAVFLLAAGAGVAGAATTLETVLTGVELIKVITPDKMQAGKLGNGREGFLHKDVDTGLVLSVAGPAVDVDEVNALISMAGTRDEAITKGLGLCVLIAAVTKDKAALTWAAEALKNPGNGWKAAFSGWDVSVSPVPDTAVFHVIIKKAGR